MLMFPFLSVGTTRSWWGSYQPRLERPERPIGRGVDRLPGLRISAEMEAEKSLIIVDGPAHEVVVIGDRVGRLDRGREGVHRDDISRDIRQMAKIAASLGRLRPSVCVSIAFTWVEHEPDGSRRTGGCRRRRGALAPDPDARDGSSRVEGPDHWLDGGAGRAPGDLLGEPDGVVDGQATRLLLRVARGELGDGLDPPAQRAAKATMARRGSFFKSSVVYWVLIMIASKT